VESEKQIMETAEGVAAAGARMLRGGAFKPRTSPYDFQGLELEGLKLLRKAKEATGLGIVTEIMSDRDVAWWPSTPIACRWARATCRTSRC
jgi:3-deoxy-7-phosphoheptulonate synthase